jgi:hypothetical protein
MSGVEGSDMPGFLSEPTAPEPRDRDNYMGRVAWVTFAAAILVIVGFVNIMYGFAAIGDAKFYADDARFIFGDLNTWGWVHVVFGSLALIAAFLIVFGTELGRWLGTFAAGVNAITQLLFIDTYPFLSVLVFALDILVVYGLIVHGGRRLDL